MGMETKCDFCGQAGKCGPKWIIRVEAPASDRKAFDGRKFHRPCADSVVKTAPSGLKLRIGPSAELSAEWAEQARLKRAREVWANK